MPSGAAASARSGDSASPSGRSRPPGPPPRATRPRGQAWATFGRNHALDTRAGDFLPVTDLGCRALDAFCVLALGTRRVVPVGATRHPTDAWVAQRLREATPFGQRPRNLLRDHDRQYGSAFAAVPAARGITILRTPHRAPQAKATGERCLAYFNEARPHQGLGQATPAPSAAETESRSGPLRAVPVLGGLHHTYHRAASGGADAFSAITAVVDGQTVSIAQAKSSAIMLVDRQGRALATPSPLGADGPSFSVTRAAATITPVGPSPVGGPLVTPAAVARHALDAGSADDTGTYRHPGAVPQSAYPAALTPGQVTLMGKTSGWVALPVLAQARLAPRQIAISSAPATVDARSSG